MVRPARPRPRADGSSTGAFMKPEAFAALSEDIHLLGDLLGGAIRRFAGEEAFALVEEVRASAKDLRGRPVARGRSPAPRPARRARAGRLADPDPRLQHLLRPDQPGRAAGPRPRAAAASVRRRRRADAREPRGGLAGAQRAGDDAEDVAEHLDRALICPVFTAHPSEARRRTILGKLAAIARQLDRMETTQLAPAERDRGHRRDRRGGRDALALRHHPPSRARPCRTRSATASNMVEESLLEVVPRVYRNFEAGLRRTYPGRDWRSRRSSASARGSAATATATRASRPAPPPRRSGSSRRACSNTTSHRMDDLWRRLSHSDRFSPAGRCAPRVDRAGRRRSSRTSPSPPEHEPYRAKCRMIAAKLRRTLDYVRSVQPSWADEAAPPAAGRLSRPRRAARRPPLIADDLRQAGAAGRGDRGRPRHDPPGRGLRRPPAHARPPPAQRPARRGARRDLPPGRRLPTTTPSSRPTSGSTCWPASWSRPAR